MSRVRRQPGRRAGFSIVELVVVLSVVAAISAAAVPGFRGAVEETRIERGVSDLHSIWLAERLYLLETGKFSGDLDTLAKAGLLSSRLLRAGSSGYEYSVRVRGGLDLLMVAKRVNSSWKGKLTLDHKGRLRNDLRDTGGGGR